MLCNDVRCFTQQHVNITDCVGEVLFPCVFIKTEEKRNNQLETEQTRVYLKYYR